MDLATINHQPSTIYFRQETSWSERVARDPHSKSLEVPFALKELHVCAGEWQARELRADSLAQRLCFRRALSPGNECAAEGAMCVNLLGEKIIAL
jgi:hypothetical protein